MPSTKERSQLAPILEPKLLQLLQLAAQTQLRCMRSAPKDEKPLILEGDLFVGNLEGAAEVAYGAPHVDAETAVVESNLVYIDKRFPKGHKYRAVFWKDKLELGQSGGHWRVHDVRFARGPSLATALKAYVDEGARSCVKP